MKRPSWLITILIIIVLFAIITNPSVDDHKQELKSLFNRRVQNSLSDEESDGFKNLGIMIGNSFAEKLIDNAVTRDNYVIFSLTRGTWKENSKIIGFGIFGNVFLSKEVKESFENSFNGSQIEEAKPSEEY
ncbi:DUF4359 domain-containing protein [Flavobacterium sp. 3HN19-14]|uniref:DUF4359 domain-containing protein n=1 Tax=Flavobacterium sp. 3HN19-14 TaxID=3448133 RepID=UPI003EE006D0